MAHIIYFSLEKKNYSANRLIIKLILSPADAISGTVRQQSKSCVFIPFTYKK